MSTLIYQELARDHELQFINYSRQYPKVLFPGKTEYKLGAKLSENFSDRIIDSINPLTWLHAAARIKAFKPDAVVFRYWNPFFAPLINIISGSLSRAGIKVAILIDNLIPHEKSFLDIWMAKRVLAHADIVFSMSKAVSQDVLVLAPQIRIKTLFHPLYEIYQSVHTQAESRIKLGLASQPVILFFGLIRPYKGLDILIRALGTIHEKLGDYSALIAGEAYEDAQKYLDLINSEGISSNVVFRNEFIADDELALYFAACDVLVLPYKTATQSGIVGIAFQMDRPVIATDVGGLGEYIEDGITGYLVAPEDPETLGRTILKFFKDDDRFRMIQNVKDRKQRFSIKNFCQSMIQELISE